MNGRGVRIVSFGVVAFLVVSAAVAWAQVAPSDKDPQPIACLQPFAVCSGLVVPGEDGTPDEPGVLPEGVEICTEGTYEEQLAAGCRPVEEFLVGGTKGKPAVSAEMAADVVAIPDADITIDPNELGLTGLLTTFSTTGGKPVTSKSTVKGYTIEATATPASYVWDFGDDKSETGQTVEHVYQQRSTFVVTLTVVYTGTYQWSGNGKSGSGDLGEVRHSTSRDYKVIEARGVLTSIE